MGNSGVHSPEHPELLLFVYNALLRAHLDREAVPRGEERARDRAESRHVHHDDVRRAGGSVGPIVRNQRGAALQFPEGSDSSGREKGR